MSGIAFGIYLTRTSSYRVVVVPWAGGATRSKANGRIVSEKESSNGLAGSHPALLRALLKAVTEKSDDALLDRAYGCSAFSLGDHVFRHCRLTVTLWPDELW